MSVAPSRFDALMRDDDGNIPQDGESIAPISFAPLSAETGRKRWRPGLLSLVTSALVILSVAILWFLLGARAVQIRVEPATASLRIQGGISVAIGGRQLMRPGKYRVLASAAGYHPLEQTLTVDDSSDQTVNLVLVPLPGLLTLELEPREAEVLIDGEKVINPTNGPIEIEAGTHELTVTASRYLPITQTIAIEGKRQRLNQVIRLQPAWGRYRIESEPATASVWLDDALVGETPLELEALEGAHQIVIRKDGFKSTRLTLNARAGEAKELPPQTLVAADAILQVRSEPAGANVTAAGVFQGQTPVDIAIEPGRPVSVILHKLGFIPYQRELRLRSGQRQKMLARLEPATGRIAIRVLPANAELLINGKSVGRGSRTLELPAMQQRIVARAEGYADAERTVTPRPGLAQSVNIKLLTEEEAKWAGIPGKIMTGAGQEMLLVRPAPFTMGASRREPGRRANESLRSVTLKKAYYLARHEITNEQFRVFKSTHSSGNLYGRSLNGGRQPVVNLSWNDAALYCNWLSERDGLPTVYTVTDDEVTGFDKEANGYRLPSEAEWAFAARVGADGTSYKFPWGNAWPPIKGAGNFADQGTANFIAQYIQDYQDGEIVSAPIGQFKENWRGFFDLGGNASEWVHDFYASAVSQNAVKEVDPMGPDLGEFHTIRDSNYRSGSIVELRLSYRDYGKDPSNTVGFRIARYVE